MNKLSGKIEIRHNSRPVRQPDGTVLTRAVIEIGGTRVATGYGPTVEVAVREAVRLFRLQRSDSDRWQR